MVLVFPALQVAGAVDVVMETAVAVYVTQPVAPMMALYHVGADIAPGEYVEAVAPPLAAKPELLPVVEDCQV